MEIRKLGGGVVVAGNEYSKADTLRVLAKAVVEGDKGDFISEVVGEGIANFADAIADSPAYQEAVEVLALRLVDVVEKNLAKIDDLEDDIARLVVDEDEDELEDEDEDEKPLVCDRCGEVIADNNEEWDYLDGRPVCYECMTAKEYIEVNE